MTSRVADTVLHTADLPSWLDWRDIYGRTPLSLACTLKSPPPLPPPLPLPLPQSRSQSHTQSHTQARSLSGVCTTTNSNVRERKNSSSSRNRDRSRSSSSSSNKENNNNNDRNNNDRNNNGNGNIDDNDNDINDNYKDTGTGCCGCIPGRRRMSRSSRLGSPTYPSDNADTHIDLPSSHPVPPTTGTPGHAPHPVPTTTGTPGRPPKSSSNRTTARTPGHRAPIRDTPASMVRALMRAGADISVVNAHTQYSPLMEAAEAGKRRYYTVLYSTLLIRLILILVLTYILKQDPWK